MTAPMLPGPWDQVKDSVQSLGLTVARSLDPQFDAKIALGQIMRDPSKIQGMIDMANLNPQAVSSIYGIEALQGLQRMGQMSAAAGVEQGARNIMGGAPEAAPNTVQAAAGANALGVPTPAEVAAEGRRATIETNTIARQNQELEVGGMDLDLRRLEDPVTKARLEARANAIRQQPEMAMANPYQLATKIASGQIDDTDAQMLQSMFELAPAAFDEFQRYLADLNQSARAEGADRRAANREMTGFRKWAADRGRETGVPQQAWLDYIMGEDTPGARAAQVFAERDQSEQERVARVREINRVTDSLKELEKVTGERRNTQLRAVEAELTGILKVPVQIVNERGTGLGWFSKNQKFKLPDGRTLDGDDLFRVADMTDEARTLFMSTPEQLQEALRNLEANPSTYDAQRFRELKAAIEAEIESRKENDTVPGTTIPRNGRTPAAPRARTRQP